MKSMIAVLAFVMLSQAQAQTSQPQVNNQGAVGTAVVQQAPVQTAPAPKRVMVYDERTNELVDAQPAQAVSQAGQSAPAVAPAPTASPIYILNSQRFNGQVDNNSNSGVATKQAQTAVQEQPTTVVQDTPLKPSAAEALRATRKESEATTEDGIVQALEKARLNDENRRRDKFNNALSSDQQAAPVVVQQVNQPAALPPQAPVQQPQAQPVYQQAQPVIVVVPQQAAPAPVVVATPVPAPQTTVVVEAPEQTEAPVRTERRQKTADLDSEIRAEQPKIEEEKPREYYVSALVGMGKYNDVINVKGNASGGVAVGKVWEDHFVAELSFLYGSYQLNDLYYSGYNPRIVDMNQYNVAIAGKYQLPIGRVVPYAGVVGSYTRRSYSDDYYGSGSSGDAFRTSNAFDAGANLGVDVRLTKMFAIGFDFRYMTNVFYRQSSNYPTSFYQDSSNEIEKLDYYTALVTAKLSF